MARPMDEEEGIMLLSADVDSTPAQALAATKVYRRRTRAERKLRRKCRLAGIGLTGVMLAGAMVLKWSSLGSGGAVDVESRQLAGAAPQCANPPGTGATIGMAAGILYFFLGLAIVCDEFFQTSLEKISDVLELSPDVAGATFLAAGSSAPELFTSLADALGESSAIGMGTIVGSAMFNILVIVALSAAVVGTAGASILVDWRPVSRDVAWYSYSILLLALFLLDGQIKTWEAMVMTFSYGFYVLFMRYNSKILAHCKGPVKIEAEEQKARRESLAKAEAGLAEAAQSAEAAQPNGAPLVGSNKVLPAGEHPHAEEAGGRRRSMTLGVRNRAERRKSSIVGAASAVIAANSLGKVPNEAEEGKAGLVAADGNAEPLEPEKKEAPIPEDKKEEAEEEEEEEGRFTIPDTIPDKILFFMGLPFLVLFTLLIPDCGKPKWEKWYTMTFFMSILAIAFLTHFMVVWALAVACALEISPVIMGTVVLAIGTSVPDAIGSMIAARDGEAGMAIANAIGSNVFDILLGLGFPWTLHNFIFSETTPVSKDDIFSNILILFCTVCLFVGVLAVNKWRMNSHIGLALFALYIIYIVYLLIMESIGS
ncbi:unnamed protein product [Chrysoparadoxa australica]